MELPVGGGKIGPLRRRQGTENGVATGGGGGGEGSLGPLYSLFTGGSVNTRLGKRLAVRYRKKSRLDDFFLANARFFCDGPCRGTSY